MLIPFWSFFPVYNTNLVAKHTSRSYDTGKAKNAVVQRRSGGDFRPNKTSWFTSWQHGLLFVRLPLVCLSWRIRRMTIGIAVVMTQPLSLLVEEGWNKKWLNEPALAPSCQRFEITKATHSQNWLLVCWKQSSFCQKKAKLSSCKSFH